MSNVEMKIEGLLDFSIDVSREKIGNLVVLYIRMRIEDPLPFHMLIIESYYWAFEDSRFGPLKNDPHVEC